MAQRNHIQGPENKQQRIDKWLQIARIFKTRSQATKACDDRRVKVNGLVTKPAKLIKPGDELTVKKHTRKFINLTILKLSFKSIPAKDAREMYDLAEYQLGEDSKELLSFYRESEKKMRPKYKGRPTKKERRILDDFKNNQIFGENG
jgi:ribosome-associated heat shock protein Hsp15